MLRLLIVLAVVLLAAAYLSMREPRDPDAEVVAPQQQLGKARGLERQMQEQAAQQLKDIDAASPQ
jgi:CHASE3 domain sensor protein